MGRSKKPKYGTVTRGGKKYFRTRITAPDGTRVSIYGRTEKEVTEKVADLRAKFKREALRQNSPTVAQYATRVLEKKRAHIRQSTFNNYVQATKKYIVEPFGDRLMCDITSDEIDGIMQIVARLSQTTYRTVCMLYKRIFASALKEHIILEDPAAEISAKGGVSPKKGGRALTDEQVKILLNAVKGLPPYTFILLALYAGLRREEILALQWDNINLDSAYPSIEVHRTWYIDRNRPYIIDDVKSEAAKRTVTIPEMLAAHLRKEKERATSPFVVCNRDGEPLSGTQYKHLWKYVTTRSTKPRKYTRVAADGEKVTREVVPVLGEKAAHNSHVTYSIDFHVTPHMLRHTYITNLIYAGVDPKTVQYLAGHENSKITMDIYAEAKYNSPEVLAPRVNQVFNIPNL